MEFKTINSHDNFFISFTLLVIDLLLSFLLFDFLGWQILLIWILLPIGLISSTSVISIQENTIRVRKFFLGISYNSIDFKFQNFHFDDNNICFQSNDTYLKIIDYEGDGYFWYDLPDSLLVEFDNRELILGNREGYKRIVKEIKKKSAH